VGGDVATGRAAHNETDENMVSVDSRRFAYDKRPPARLRAVFVYNMPSGRLRRIQIAWRTCSRARNANGKRMHFLASNTLGLQTSLFDMSSFELPTRRSLAIVQMRSNENSLLLSESDEESTGAATAPPVPSVTINFRRTRLAHHRRGGAIAG